MSPWRSCPCSTRDMSSASSGTARTTLSVDFEGPPRRRPTPLLLHLLLRAYLRATSTRVGAAQTPPPLRLLFRPPLRRYLPSPSPATRARAVWVAVSRSQSPKTTLESYGSPLLRTSTTPVRTSRTTNHGAFHCRYSKPDHLNCRRTLSSTHQRPTCLVPTDSKVDAFWSTMPTAVSLRRLALNRTQHRPTSKTTLYQEVEKEEAVWRR